MGPGRSVTKHDTPSRTILSAAAEAELGAKLKQQQLEVRIPQRRIQHPEPTGPKNPLETDETTEAVAPGAPKAKRSGSIGAIVRLNAKGTLKVATSPAEEENGLTVPGKAVNTPIVPNTSEGGRPGQVSPRGTKDGGASLGGPGSNYKNHYSGESSKASAPKPRLGGGSRLAIQHSTPSENCTTIEGGNTGTSSGGLVNTESSPGEVNS